MKIINKFKKFYKVITYENKHDDENYIFMIDLLKWGSIK